MSAREKQVGGDHYAKHTIQPIDIIDDHNLDFYEGNAVKYILRYKDKNGIEDLEKAKHYIDLKIERLKRAEEKPKEEAAHEGRWHEVEEPAYLMEEPPYYSTRHKHS